MKRNITYWTEHKENVICTMEEKGREIVEYSFTLPELEEEEILYLEWYETILDIVGCWYPDCRYERIYGADWQKQRKTMLSISAPVYCLFNQRGENRYTLAVSEAMREVWWKIGVHEENGKFLFRLKMHLGRGKKEVKLLVNRQDMHYTESLKFVQRWWEDSCKIMPAYVPQAAKMPFYSTWYSYHQNLSEKELEKECELAAKLGFKGIIVDDGWQTEDSNRGYAFCGDWKPSEEKFPNMKEHVAFVHSLGLKYMLWVSVPFIGEKSKIWNRFSDKLLMYQEDMGAGVLDIRYKEVREYLIMEYTKLVETYKLDGLKLDFIDEFYEGKHIPPYIEAMDIRDVQDALECMMTELYEKLRGYNQDILIEFRQKYIGPYIRKFGNILRVDDCPMSYLANKVGIADLRILSGDTAVHSDMVMWNPDETIEEISVALLHCFFGCLQLSILLNECSEDVIKVIRHYMCLAEEYFKVRLEGSFLAESPENLYPVLCGEKENEAAVGVYEENKVIKLKSNWKKILLLNATHSKEMFIETEQDCVMHFIIRDCKGEIFDNYVKQINGVIKFFVPIGGSVSLNIE